MIDFCATREQAEDTLKWHVSRLLGHANPSITLSIYAHAFAGAEHDE